MKKLFRLKKLLTFMVCLAAMTSIMSFSLNFYESPEIDAQTVAELQEQKKKNQQAISDLESALDSLENSKAQESAYQETLNEQITLMENNIQIVEEELTRINNDITIAEDNINSLNNDIAVQEVNVADNTELFKERLRAMYVTGNDSLATAVLGSTDFYDMLSRVEMVKRIAEHDSDLIETLKNDIEQLETLKSALETEKLTLEMKQEEQVEKKEEFNSYLDQYNVAMRKSQDEVERLNRESEMTENEIKEHKDAMAKADAEIEEIIRRNQEEEKRKAREAAAAKAAAEEAARQQQTAQNNTNNNVGSDTNTNTNVGNNTGSNTNTETVTQPSATGFSWPVPGQYYVSSEYGYRWGSLHKGLDIAGGSIAGASACASKAGTVIAVSTSCTHNYPKDSNCCGNGYGNYVIISHDGTYSTLYGHMQAVYVSVGDYVSAGQVIGAVGCTGFSTGYHLHFEIWENGSAVNPRNYL